MTQRILKNVLDYITRNEITQTGERMGNKTVEHVSVVNQNGEASNLDVVCSESKDESDLNTGDILFSSNMNAFALENRGQNIITFNVGAVKFKVDPGVCTDVIRFAAFTEVSITGTSPIFQAWGFV